MNRHDSFGAWTQADFSAADARAGGAPHCKHAFSMRVCEARGLNWGGSPTSGQDMHMPEWRGIRVDIKPVFAREWGTVTVREGDAAPLLAALKAGGPEGFRVVNTWLLGGG